jgi:hypothetical protein
MIHDQGSFPADQRRAFPNDETDTNIRIAPERD